MTTTTIRRLLMAAVLSALASAAHAQAPEALSSGGVRERVAAFQPAVGAFVGSTRELTGSLGIAGALRGIGKGAWQLVADSAPLRHAHALSAKRLGAAPAAPLHQLVMDQVATGQGGSAYASMSTATGWGQGRGSLDAVVLAAATGRP